MYKSSRSFFTLVYSFIIVILYLFPTGCSIENNRLSLDDFYRIEKIDSHVHMNSDDATFIEQARPDNFQLLTVNVDYPDFPPLEVQQDIAIRAYRKYPDIVAFASSFFMAGWDDEGWQNRTIAHLDLAARMGNLQYLTSQDRTKVRDFFIDYQDRILYGSDLVYSPEMDPMEIKNEAHKIWFSDWTYFVTDLILTNSDFPESFQGLALPVLVIEKVYRINAKKIFDEAWPSEIATN